MNENLRLKINEIYLSVQGEEHVGGAAVRFRASDRLQSPVHLLRHRVPFTRESAGVWTIF